jgi:hypothetical protein
MHFQKKQIYLCCQYNNIDQKAYKVKGGRFIVLHMKGVFMPFMQNFSGKSVLQNEQTLHMLPAQLSRSRQRIFCCAYSTALLASADAIAPAPFFEVRKPRSFALSMNPHSTRIDGNCGCRQA